MASKPGRIWHFFKGNREGDYVRWEIVRIIWPRTCFISGKKIPFFSKAYRARNFSSGYQYRHRPDTIWISESEYVMGKLKGDIE